ncbi:hypothetical protein BJV78DRAFT_1249039 [Lactifluus subvellereus]|nr:hypothetical protein BJV78DRAFT_1249039 [Lactifluus subvellereus]
MPLCSEYDASSARDSNPSRPSVPRFVSSTPSTCSEISLVQELCDRIRIKTSTPLSLQTRPRSLILTRSTSRKPSDINFCFPFHLVALRPTSRTLLTSPLSLIGYIVPEATVHTHTPPPSLRYWRAVMYMKYCGSPLAGHGSFIGLLFVLSTSSLRDFLLPAFSLRSSLRQSGLTCRRTLAVERQEPVSFSASVSVFVAVPTPGALPPLVPTAAGLTSSRLARLFRF